MCHLHAREFSAHAIRQCGSALFVNTPVSCGSLVKARKGRARAEFEEFNASAIDVKRRKPSAGRGINRIGDSLDLSSLLVQALNCGGSTTEKVQTNSLSAFRAGACRV